MSQDKEIKSKTTLENKSEKKPDHTIHAGQKLTHKKPGRLKGEVHLTLHTAYAQKLFLGFRPDKRSINLLQFGAHVE